MPESSERSEMLYVSNIHDIVSQNILLKTSTLRLFTPIIHLMHCFEVNIRICQPEKVMFTSVDVIITFSGGQILMLTSKQCVNCLVI